MLQIKNSALIISMLLLFACIKPYDPVIDASVKSKYVVSGRITDIEGWQEVEVSLSSPVDLAKYVPLPGCQVNVADDKGNVFTMVEFTPGLYRVWMTHENLVHGTSYKVRVVTPGGDELVSGYDQMPAGPVLDSIYYALKDIPTTDPAVSNQIMQFYVDINASGDYSKYYKWEVLETWEYHAVHILEYYYDGKHHKVDPPDSSKKVCWITSLAKNVFTVSTKSLAQNTYKQFPLHNIDGKSSRLGILYSMLVSQFALSEKAYTYWEKLRINSNDQGGLYEKQPLAIKGNLVNLTHPDLDVLGYFYATSQSSRRYFYKDVPGLQLDYNNHCVESSLGRFGWKEFTRDDYPVYYYYPATWILRILDHECVNCTLGGGVTVKPDFWPY
jgi:Domain of unknown function (DUF4249)